jgi:hypothetical protein
MCRSIIPYALQADVRVGDGRQQVLALAREDDRAGMVITERASAKAQECLKEIYERRAVPAKVGDRNRLDLRGFDTKGGPVTWGLHVVEVPPLDLIRAQRGPPHVLGELGERKCGGLGEGRRAGLRPVRKRLNKGKQVVVGERARAGEGVGASHGTHRRQVGQSLGDV